MTLNTRLLSNPTVKKAIEALQHGDVKNWFSLFEENAELYDDGEKIDFRNFFEKALGHEWFTSIDRVEDKGLTIYGKFHSEQWGDFNTYFKFQMIGKSKINRLDIGQEVD